WFNALRSTPKELATACMLSWFCGKARAASTIFSIFNPARWPRGRRNFFAFCSVADELTAADTGAAESWGFTDVLLVPDPSSRLQPYGVRSTRLAREGTYNGYTTHIEAHDVGCL